MTLYPYRYYDAWVFDDPTTGLVREPFVSGADDIIDKMVANIPNAEAGFTMLFSSQYFPGALRMEWCRADEAGVGNWYYSADFDMEGWLCPALFKYFPAAPPEIYVQCKKSNPPTRT